MSTTTVTPIEARKDRDTPTLVKSYTVDFEGQEYTLDAVAVNSLEFLEAMRDDDLVGVIQMAITREGYLKLKDQLRDADTGYTPLERLRDFMGVLMKSDQAGPTAAS